MYAQKSYVMLETDNYNGTVYLGGDIPEGINSSYSIADIASLQGERYYTYRPSNNLGFVINLLAKLGYVVESQSSIQYKDADHCRVFCILSKDSSSDTSTKIRAVKEKEKDNEDTDDAVEVARYNLQGIPVKESDKGLQIIVYFNYTTKTVLVQ